MADIKTGPNPDKKKVEKVVSGSVKVKKKNGVTKFADNFISEDIHNVKSYVITDVLIPSVKRAISEMVTNGIDMILYGSTGGRSKRSSADRVSYRNYYDRCDDDRYRDRDRDRVRTSAYSFDDIVLDSRDEAKEVLARMNELIDQYGIVSVADLYDLVGITGNYTDNKYGWTNIRNAEPIRVRDGYMLRLPKALPIN